MSEYKKWIYILVALIIFLATILLVKIRTMPQYDPKIYADVYDEYERIFEEDEDIHKIEESITQNIAGNNNTTEANNNYESTVGTIVSNTSNNGNVIGKIIIPKIEIRYPIIKETTEEYLKVALTKYCGPEVNEKRKLSNCRA